MLLVLCASALPAVPAPEGYLEIDTVIFLDLVDGVPKPLPEKDAMRLLADEASWLVKAMVYGFRFTYRPGDRARQTGEVFELEPLGAEIDTRGFELPRFVEGRNRLSARFTYRMKDWELRRYNMWYSNIIPESPGRGAAPLELGPEGRIAAHKEAIHTALYNYFRTQVANKPQLIVGEVAISSSPVAGIDGGEYVSSLRIRIRPGSVTGYEAQ